MNTDVDKAQSATQWYGCVRIRKIINLTTLYKYLQVKSEVLFRIDEVSFMLEEICTFCL